MNIALLNIGGELLDGRTVNSNASYFASVLKGAGLRVTEVRMIEDDIDAIVQSLNDLGKYDEVIVSGGLGPTADDITAIAAAKFAAQKQVYLPAAKKMIQRQLGLEKQKFTAGQKRQAFLPEKAKIIDNRWGIAPGFWLRRGACIFSFLPGVPRECRPMLEASVLPRILRSGVIKTKLKERLVWQCFGAKEADIYALIAKEIESAQKIYGGNFSFSCLIPFPIIQIRLEFWQGRGAKSASKAERKRIAKKIDQKIKKFVFSRKEGAMAAQVLETLAKQNATVATAESCTGGLVAAAFTDIPGSSAQFLGGIVSYSNEAKQKLLGVNHASLRRHGAVSKVVVEEMAEGARQRFRSSFAISISGVAGPDGGTEAKPVGTLWFAVAGPKRTIAEHVWCKQGKGTREQNRKYALSFALNLLLREIESTFQSPTD